MQSKWNSPQIVSLARRWKRKFSMLIEKLLWSNYNWLWAPNGWRAWVIVYYFWILFLLFWFHFNCVIAEIRWKNISSFFRSNTCFSYFFFCFLLKQTNGMKTYVRAFMACVGGFNQIHFFSETVCIAFVTSFKECSFGWVNFRLFHAKSTFQAVYLHMENENSKLINVYTFPVGFSIVLCQSWKSCAGTELKFKKLLLQNSSEWMLWMVRNRSRKAQCLFTRVLLPLEKLIAKGIA